MYNPSVYLDTSSEGGLLVANRVGTETSNPDMLNCESFFKTLPSVRDPPSISFDHVEFIRNGFDVEELIRTKIHEDPEHNAFYVVNLSDVVLKRRQWSQLLPRVQPYYAVKCNPDKEVLKTLALMGVNFDCASRPEIEAVMALGVTTDRIIYSNPCKQKSHLSFARDVGVNLSVFDDVAELYKFRECHPRCKLLVRIFVDDKNSVCQFSMKFGAKEADVPKLLTVAKQLELDVVGVHFHVGSGCYDLESYASALHAADRVFKVAEQIGFQMNTLDIGGGFPGSWSARGDDGSGVTFAKIAAKMQPMLDEMFPLGKVRLIAEPGRYFVASSHTLVVNVIGLRKFEVPIDDSNKECDISSPTSPLPASRKHCKFSYYVNDGLYGAFNNIMFDHAHVKPVPLSPTPETSFANQPHYPSTIFGPTCDGIDCIIKDYALPELNVGDWIYFSNMGAYTKAAASQFNGFPVARSYYYLSSREFLE
jgi:ornithine decarboxylase